MKRKNLKTFERSLSSAEKLEMNSQNEIHGGGWIADYIADLFCGCIDFEVGEPLPITTYDSKW